MWIRRSRLAFDESEMIKDEWNKLWVKGFELKPAESLPPAAKQCMKANIILALSLSNTVEAKLVLNSDNDNMIIVFGGHKNTLKASEESSEKGVSVCDVRGRLVHAFGLGRCLVRVNSLNLANQRDMR